MTIAIKPAPVRKSIQVAVPPEKAFAVFTRMGSWWAKGHSINTATTQKDVVIEPQAGGRWYEIGVDGSTCQWGTVLAWEPPRRLLLNWQIDGTWKFNADFQTELEIRFVPDGAGTRVELEHRNLERYGDANTVAGIGLDTGWAMLVGRFAAFAEGKPLPEPKRG